MQYFLEFNNQSSEDLRLKIIDRVSIPMPKKKYRTYTIAGADGDYLEYDGTEDIQVPVQFNFIDLDENEHNRIARVIKKWLLCIQDNKLRFSDDWEYYYRVKKVECDEDIERAMYIGVFTVMFTCEAYQYTYDGSNFFALNNGEVLFNNESKESLPIFKIEGEGLIKLTVNSSTIEVNVGQVIYIDSEEGLIYRENGDIITTGKGEFPILQLGTNKISWTGNAKVSVKTNYRSY